MGPELPVRGEEVEEGVVVFRAGMSGKEGMPFLQLPGTTKGRARLRA